MKSGVRAIIPAGSVYGNWTVIGPAHPPVQNGYCVWNCQCSCGSLKPVSGVSLRSGQSRKCKGCAAIARRQRSAKDISGQTFGGWRVLSEIPREERPDKTKNRAWLCECLCGTRQALALPQLKKSKVGCRACSSKINGQTQRLRPYESVYRSAKTSITNKLGRKQVYDFTITYEEFLEIVETGKCHYCHAPLSWAKHMSKERCVAYRLDRKNNALGYVTGNVAACCKRCNYSKGANYSYEEWYRMTECFRHGEFLPSASIGSGFGSPFSRPR